MILGALHGTDESLRDISKSFRGFLARFGGVTDVFSKVLAGLRCITTSPRWFQGISEAFLQASEDFFSRFKVNYIESVEVSGGFHCCFRKFLRTSSRKPLERPEMPWILIWPYLKSLEIHTTEISVIPLKWPWKHPNQFEKKTLNPLKCTWNPLKCLEMSLKFFLYYWNAHKILVIPLKKTGKLDGTPFVGLLWTSRKSAWLHLKCPGVRPLQANYIFSIKPWLNVCTSFPLCMPRFQYM